MSKDDRLAKAREALKNRQPRPSMRQAINAKCKDCIYDPEEGGGTWRQQVEACTITDCPLYPVRPTSKGKAKE